MKTQGPLRFCNNVMTEATGSQPRAKRIHMIRGWNLSLRHISSNSGDSVSGQLAPINREQYTYNLRGFYTYRFLEEWNTVASEWENVSRDRFDYTPKGIWTTWHRAVWDGSWRNEFRRDYKFLDGLQVDVEQTWNADSSKLVNNRRRFLKFDDYGNLAWERNFEHWNSATGEWVNGPATAQCRHFWSEESTSGTSFVYENLIDCRYMNPYLLSSEIQCLSLDPGTPDIMPGSLIRWGA